MRPIYTDIHIHTSENPDNLNQNYDVENLFAKVRSSAQGESALISITDHNTINEHVYLDAISKCKDDIHLLLGVELHVHYTKKLMHIIVICYLKKKLHLTIFEK